MTIALLAKPPLQTRLVRAIKKLFASGAPGAWYDPSDINLNWRYNLLTYTEQFDNAVWVKFRATITANATTAPDGTTTADKLVEDTTINNTHGAGNYGSQLVTAEGIYTFSAYVKAAERQYVTLFGDVSSGRLGNGVQFSLIDGAVTRNTSSLATTATNLGNDWWRFSITATASSSGTCYSTLYAGEKATVASNGVDSYTGNGISGIYIWGAQLQTGSVATTYQQIVTPEISYLNYKPQPILYQDSAGTTPVTAVEQPVGLMLDKSKGLVLGSELVTNGDFSGPSLSSFVARGTSVLTITGGQLVATTANAGAIAVLSTTIGKTYQILGSITAASATVFIDKSDSSSAFTNRVQFVTGATVPQLSKQGVFTATATTTYLWFWVNDATAGSSITIDNISVRELPGNHAFQTTAASRPVLSARYNLLTKTEALTDVAWTKIASGTGTAPIVTAGFADPIGGNTAFRVQLNIGVGTTIGDLCIFRQVVSVTGTTTTKSLYVRSNTGLNQLFHLTTNNGKPLITATPEFTLVSASDTDNFIDVGIAGSSGTSKAIDVIVWHPSLVPTNQSTLPYQRVNTSTDYDTVGFKPYLVTDGVDDGMVTNSIDFTTTDKMTVCAGVRKLTSGVQVALELSSNVDTNNNAFNIASDAVGSDNWYFSSGSSAQGQIYVRATTYAAPITNVIAVGYNRSVTGSSQIAPRVNALTPTLASVGTGSTGNYGNYPLYLFRRGGTTLPFNGRFYGMTVVGKTVTAGEFASLEAYTNQKTGAY